MALADLVKISLGMLSGPRHFPSVKDIIAVSGSRVWWFTLSMYCPKPFTVFLYVLSIFCILGFLHVPGRVLQNIVQSFLYVGPCQILSCHLLWSGGTNSLSSLVYVFLFTIICIFRNGSFLCFV